MPSGFLFICVQIGLGLFRGLSILAGRGVDMGKMTRFSSLWESCVIRPRAI